MPAFDIAIGAARILQSVDGEPILNILANDTEGSPVELELSGRDALEALQSAVYEAVEQLNLYENRQDMQKGVDTPD